MIPVTIPICLQQHFRSIRADRTASFHGVMPTRYLRRWVLGAHEKRVFSVASAQDSRLSPETLCRTDRVLLFTKNLKISNEKIKVIIEIKFSKVE